MDVMSNIGHPCVCVMCTVVYVASGFFSHTFLLVNTMIYGSLVRSRQNIKKKHKKESLQVNLIDMTIQSVS